MEKVETRSETKLITGEELLGMGEIGRCELIDGKIIPMSPTGSEHAILESKLAFRLQLFDQDRNSGWVTTGEAGIYINRNPDRIRGADVVFISKMRLSEPTGKFLETAPELVVEVMSPGDQWEEVRAKLADYFSINVEQVWVIEPKNRKFLVYDSITNFQEFSEGEVLRGQGFLEGFELDIAIFFSW